MSEDELESLVMASTPTPTPTFSFVTLLVSGGLAGTTVDVALFPIDTIKTRLQSPQSFQAAGGFRGIYNGLGAAALGSAPGAALFFSTYESSKPLVLQALCMLNNDNDTSSSTTTGTTAALSHMIAASMGEAVACLVRVPTEVIKAKMQTSTHTFTDTVKTVLNEQPPSGARRLGRLTGGLYRGYGITLLREIPFAMIQFPLYEYFKLLCASRQGLPTATPLQAALCGSVSGGIAAAVTTPLDVIKTRLMLGKDRNGRPYKSGWDVFTKIVQQEGAMTLFAGLQPRVMWISIGGFVFLGSYEAYRGMLQPVF